MLKLELPKWDPNGGVPEYVRIDRTLRGLHFPHLYELALSQCDVKGKWLVDFLLRHKATLRRLSLSYVSLVKVKPSWREVFTSISCQLPHLYKVNVYGEFQREFHPPILFEHKGSATSTSYNRAIEDFILRGGTYPTEDSVRRRARESDVDESDEYSLYGVSDDDIASDDPILDYESDEYDDWF